MATLTEEMLLAKTHKSTLEEIRNVTLWGANLEDITILSTLPNLESVSLSINKISTLKPFSPLLNLRELYLRKNNIVDVEELKYLQPLKALRFLWLENNPICTQVQDYRLTVIKYLPQLNKLDQKTITEDERAEAANLASEHTEPIEHSAHEEESQDVSEIKVETAHAVEPVRGVEEPVKTPEQASEARSTSNDKQGTALGAVLHLLDVLEEDSLAILGQRCSWLLNVNWL